MCALFAPNSLAPHAPAYAREYTQTLFVKHDKRSKVPWKLPGTVWLWSTKPDLVRVGVDRLDLDPVSGAGGKIPLLFPAQDEACFRTVDVVVSAAPPEFSNARKYLLRFHLTYIDPTAAPNPRELSDVGGGVISSTRVAGAVVRRGSGLSRVEEAR